MSGNGGLGAAVGAIGGGTAGFFLGGPLGAISGAEAGATILGTAGNYSDNQQASAARHLKNSLLQPISQIKPLPTIDDAAVKAVRNKELLSLQQKTGRASTLLSGTQGTKTTFG